MVILVTGATGTVMSRVTSLLLAEGHTVLALVRDNGQEAPRKRLARTLALSSNDEERLRVLVGNIRQPYAGASSEDIQEWCGKVEVIVHGAASVKFDETPDNEVFSTNVQGTQHILQLAHALKIKRFCHVSTAFVAGEAAHFREEDIPHGPGRTVYEDTKIIAEALVRVSDIPYSIIRIPVVVGDSTSGEIGSFTGYYRFFASFFLLREALIKQWEQNRTRLEEGGITIGRNGKIHLPITIPCSETGTLNMVPVDWVAQGIKEIVEKETTNQALHLTHPRPPSVSQLIETSLRSLGIEGVQCREGPAKDPETSLLRSLQRSIRKAIAPFLPYILKPEEGFDNTRVRELLKNYDQPPDMLERVPTLIRFAESRKFGRGGLPD